MRYFSQIILGIFSHQSNESPWKPREVPVDDARILMLDANQIPLRLTNPNQLHEKLLPK
jgi:hypothetical protein